MEPVRLHFEPQNNTEWSQNDPSLLIYRLNPGGRAFVIEFLALEIPPRSTFLKMTIGIATYMPNQHFRVLRLAKIHRLVG